MPITISGIRVLSLTVSRDEDGCDDKVSLEYGLMSSEGKILAKQHLSTKQSYNETLFVPPSDVLKQLSGAVTAYKKAVEQHLGISE